MSLAAAGPPLFSLGLREVVVWGQGVAVFGPVRFDGPPATAYYFYDPVDNLLEFWAPDD